MIAEEITALKLSFSFAPGYFQIETCWTTFDACEETFHSIDLKKKNLFLFNFFLSL